MNLLKETIEDLKDHGLTEKDVLWVGSHNAWITWENFKQIADIEYDSGYGSVEIPLDLMIVGDGWWMERNEYDGSEGWQVRRTITKPDKFIVATKIKIENYSVDGFLELNTKEE